MEFRVRVAGEKVQGYVTRTGQGGLAVDVGAHLKLHRFTDCDIKGRTTHPKSSQVNLILPSNVICLMENGIEINFALN